MTRLIILMAFFIPLEAGGSSWFTVNAPRWRRDAEAERHRVSGTCKFSDVLWTPTTAFLYFFMKIWILVASNIFNGLFELFEPGSKTSLWNVLRKKSFDDNAKNSIKNDRGFSTRSYPFLSRATRGFPVNSIRDGKFNDFTNFFRGNFCHWNKEHQWWHL